MIISLIAAVSLNGVIGKANKLPWHMPADLRQFKRKTMGHHLLMGSRTFQSIGSLLPGRTTVVVSSKMDPPIKKDYYVMRDIEAAIQLAKTRRETELFVIGGSIIYQQLLPLADQIYLTKIYTTVEGDSYFPLLDETWIECSIDVHLADECNPYNYAFITLMKRK